jgi:hypothetical protein
MDIVLFAVKPSIGDVTNAGYYGLRGFSVDGHHPTFVCPSLGLVCEQCGRISRKTGAGKRTSRFLLKNKKGLGGKRGRGRGSRGERARMGGERLVNVT